DYYCLIWHNNAGLF
nr:immunoglobulin light chain junction region [Macaca mulatta]MOX76142.1 immunoglobulin light chain junction region [Macaca mulatta]MOX76907.1 immunoglobulin light chain junction region [Macaca mulatta]MOX79447.1 immunoglobulin light chain junction region [Macaca mulatta]MOX81501.1 immunoglobulin light chain junction region [Macaca mulatta]